MNVSVKGLSELSRRYLDAEPSVKKAMIQNIANLGQFGLHLCKSELKDVRYTGALEGSFVVEINDADIEARIYPTASHSMFVRTGTRPHWPPPGPIKSWAAAKLGDESLGFLVSRSIAEHGTSVFQLRKRGTKENPWPERVVNTGAFQNALRRTTDHIGSDVIAKV
jgi:hypothetical protein